jgi:dynein heavy chain
MFSVLSEQGQEPIAERELAAAREKGGWVLLQNIHLTIDWTSGTLDKIVDKLAENSDPNFRCACTGFAQT